MKILIVSDTHGRNTNFNLVYGRVKPVDMVIHLGDVENGRVQIQDMVECELKMIAGNNDFSCLPAEDLFYIGRYLVFLTHGNRYGVYYGVETLKDAARQRGADIVLYGHTHCPKIDLHWNDVWVVNPGSLSLPRQGNRKPSYCIMELDKEGEAHFTINYL